MGRVARRGRGLERVALAALVGVMFACGGRALVGGGNEVDGGADSGGLTPSIEAAAPDGARDAAVDAGGWHPLVGEIDPTFQGSVGTCGGSAVAWNFGIAPDDSLRVATAAGGGEMTFVECFSRLDRDGHLVASAPGAKGVAPAAPLVLALANGESALVRRINGALSVSFHDASWGLRGTVTKDADAGFARGERLLREAAGSAILVGSVLARIEDAGIGSVAPLPLQGAASCSALDSAGRVLATGSLPDGGEGRLVAIRPDFTVDPAFGDGGVVDTGRRGHVASTAAGSIYVAIPGPTTRVHRFVAGGALDTMFGSGGTVDLPLNSRRGVEVATERDGRLVIIRLDDSVVPNRASLSRLTLAGEIDTTFGAEGTLALPDTCALVSPGELAFQSDGRLLFLCSAELMRVR